MLKLASFFFLVSFCVHFLLVYPNGMAVLFFQNVLKDSSMTEYSLNLPTVITSYLHMGDTVTMKGINDKGIREKVCKLAADRALPWPLFLFHLDPFLSRPRGGFAGLEAGLRGALL